jgi:hypothetical protein
MPLPAEGGIPGANKGTAIKPTRAPEVRTAAA